MLKNNDISIPEACYADLCKVGFFERKQVKLTIIWNEKISRNKQILTLKKLYPELNKVSMNILVQEYRCSGGTETANPAAGNRCSETGIPHLVTSYLCEFTRLKLDLIHILPAWTCNYLGLSG